MKFLSQMKSSLGDKGIFQTGGKGRNIRKRILVPLAFVLVFLLAISVISVYWLQSWYVKRNVEICLKEVQKLLSTELDEDAELLSSQIDTLEDNKNLQDAWQAKDRDKLLSYAMPIFEEMRSQHQVTHFYFVDPDGVCFLRVHKPKRYGDKIDRFTLDTAKREEAQAHGIEIGPLGTFALRVVRPWKIDGELVGYIELGEEIDHITPKLKEIIGAEMFFVINKKYLDRNQWNEGLETMGQTGEWDLFSKFVVVDQTTKSIPSQLRDYLEKHQSDIGLEHFSSTVEVSIRKKRLLGGFVPLIDAGSRDVGEIIVLHDIREEGALLRTILIILVISGSAVGLSLFTFLYFCLGRIEKDIQVAQSGLMLEIEKRKEQEKQLAHLATHDALTGLPNRRALEEALKRAMSRARRGTESTLLFLDVDNFKPINDAAGHISGDKVLITLTRVLQESLRTEDFLARTGGDEFAILLEQTDIDQAQDIAERTRQSVEEGTFAVNGHEFQVSISIGIALVDGEQDIWESMSNADDAMYRAKKRGHNQVCSLYPAKK